jgi:hypothetical protein
MHLSRPAPRPRRAAPRSGAHICTIACALAVCTSRAAAQSLLWDVAGAPQDEVGTAIAAAGDIDGDGRGDLLVGMLNGSFDGQGTGVVWVVQGKSGVVLDLVPGFAVDDDFGTAVVGLGDVNADGVPDFAVGANREDSGGSDAGRIGIYSGANGQLLFTRAGEAAWDCYGTSLDALGDLDGDGVVDLIVGAAPSDPEVAPDAPGYVHVLSGKTGAELQRWSAGIPGDAFGRAVAAVGDVDHDGLPDALVGAPQPFSGFGYAQLRSGASGAVLYQWSGSTDLDVFGEAVCGPGDTDGDGTPDVLVGAPGASPNGLHECGRARLYSGATGALVYDIGGSDVVDHLGAALAPGGDWNADGKADFLVGAPFDDTFGPDGLNNGAVVLISGANADLLHVFAGAKAGQAFGRRAALAGDLDGDLAPDYAFSAYHSSSSAADLLYQGEVRTFSSRPMLVSPTTQISLGAGGIQPLYIQAPAKFAGSFYFVLGSAGPIYPGVGFAGSGVTLPLALDDYLLYTATYPNQTPLVGTLGVITPGPPISARIVIPPGSSPALAGIELQHAYLVLAPGLVQAASNAVPLTLVP